MIDTDLIKAAFRDRYTIEQELGRGGSSVVYLARNKSDGAPVALKVLSPELVGSSGGDRFALEIKVARDLEHPNILPLLEAGTHGGFVYYTMPFVEGATLRDRIEKDGALPIHEAVAVACDVANALGYAHERGVIHRDIKPANVLISGDRAIVADFGIARALSGSDTEGITSTGVAIGTPHYMSPEQIGGSQIDGRSDIYSLGCVLFEMLAGEPPFTGRTPQVIWARHVQDPPASLRTLRSTISLGLEAAVFRALEKVPADRFETCGQLAAAVYAARDPAPPPPAWRRMRYAVGALVVAAVTWGVLFGPGWPPVQPGVQPDSTRYAVLPAEPTASWAGSVPIHTMVQDALGRWQGITVVDALVVEGITSDVAGSESLTRDRLAELAAAADAGRLVTLHPAAVGDSVRVEARLVDPMSSVEPIRRTTFMIGSDPPTPEGVVAVAVEDLLFGARSTRGGALVRHTGSVAAARQFLLGEEALAGWHLPEAERRLAGASELDPFFDLALFWQAQVAGWRGRPTEEWEVEARRAVRSADVFEPRERRLAEALSALVERRYLEACSIYDQMREQRPDDFAALFGLGECRRRDPVVVRDVNSRTGWSFRASAHAAASAYRRAFESLPSNFRSFGPGSPELVRRLLYAGRGQYREGVSSPPDSRVFIGFGEWRGDSLAFVALPRDSAALFDSDLLAQADARTRQRRALLDVAHGWAEAFPTSSGAVHTLALARELVGDESAIDTYREARQLAQEPAIRAEIGIAEVLLRLRLSIPGDSAGLRTAVVLADSIVEDPLSGSLEGPDRLAGLAVLLGRPALAARLARAGIGGDAMVGSIPNEVAREAEALLAFAAVGAPAESIQALEARTQRLIGQSVPASEARGVLRAVLEQPAFLAFPNDTLRYLEDDALPVGRYARAVAAVVSGDATEAVAMLGEPLPEAGWDVLIARANVLVAAGREDAALSLLRTHVGSLAVADPAEVGSVSRLGGLVRAIALRAELEATRESFEAAAQWARVAEILWESGESPILPVLERMRDISDSQDGR